MRELQNSRPILLVTGAIIGVLGILIASIPFLISLSPSDTPTIPFKKVINISDIEPGKFEMIEFFNEPIIIFRPSSEIINDLIEINNKVWGPQLTEIDIPRAFVYVGISTYKGCRLTHIPKGKETWGEDWKGGWIDPCSIGAWDYAGRAVRNINTPNGMKLENLRKPNYRLTEDNILELSYVRI